MPRQKQIRVYSSKVTLKLSSVPFDMMRYDNLVPATEDDSRRLESLASARAGEAEDSVVVTFRRFAMNPGEPTIGRYRGYGAHVVSWEADESVIKVSGQ